MSRQKSSNQQSTATTSKPITLQDIDGVAIAGNEVGRDLTITDGGAIKGSLDLAGSVVENAAKLTLDLVKAQADSSRGALDFAMSAGRSDVDTQQKSMNVMLYMAAIVAGAYVMSRWAK